jgi:hypothetical protein
LTKTDFNSKSRQFNVMRAAGILEMFPSKNNPTVMSRARKVAGSPFPILIAKTVRPA